MKITKSLFVAGVVTTFAVASLAGIGAASAHGSNNRISGSEEKMTQRQEKRAERLETLVQQGTLSEEQRAALEAKHEEMHNLRDELKNQNVPRAEMRERMKESREAFKAWVTEQGIDLQALHTEGGHGHGHRSGMHSKNQN